MMDLKEIIKWFIPCFHILQVILKKNLKLSLICMFLIIGCASGVARNDAKNLISYNNNKLNQSDVIVRYNADNSVARTFGRPFLKKMMGALLPLVFQIGAASTWAVVAALVGIKTLVVTLIILKILLMAGAAKIVEYAVTFKIPPPPPSSPFMWMIPKYDQINGKLNNSAISTTGLVMPKFGALFGAHKSHHKESWEPPHHPQKEIHLHIHNGGHHEVHDDHQPVYGPWSREDATSASQKVNAIEPYFMAGPQTIKTPFGNYMKIESADPQYNPTAAGRK